VAVQTDLQLPTGDQSILAGDGVASFVARLVLGYRLGQRLRVSGNIGYRLRPARRFFDLQLGDEIPFAVSALYRLDARRFGALWAGAELSGALGLGDRASLDFATRASPVVLLGVARYARGDRWQLTLAAGSGLNTAAGVPDVRALLMVQASFGTTSRGGGTPRELVKRGGEKTPTTQPAASRRRPNDRVASKRTPRVTAAMLSALSKHDPDPDGDGLVAPLDRCPEQPEDRDGFKDKDGCPDLDNDADGIPDSSDRCPLKAEVFNGVEDDDGCPDQKTSHKPMPRALAKSDKAALRYFASGVLFRSGSDVLTVAARQTLDRLARLLVARYHIRKLRVEGHTDKLGDAEMNVDLSQRRAERVCEYLGQRGVAIHRLVAKGFGATRPVASNRSREGRKQNRRVVFVVVKRAQVTR
jgi:outer membrane protein OmpA-like peptidoglycan-associated protein